MFFRFVLFALCISVVGCAERFAAEHFRDAQKEVGNVRAEMGAKWTGKEVRDLTWKESLRLLNLKNLELRRSRYTLKELLGEREHFMWRQVDPRLIAYVNFNAVLGDLSSLSSDGLGASLLGSVNVPDPVGVYGRRYALELQYYQALLAHSKLERDLKIALYDLFLSQKDLDDWRDVLVDERGGDYKKVLGGVVSRLKKEARKLKMQEDLRVRLNKILDSPGENWKLRSETLPKISYASRMSRLDFSKGYARLAVYQMAGQLEVANARLWQVKFTQVPRVNSGVSLPQFYNVNNEQDFQFQDVGLFMSLNRSIEFTGRRKRDRLRAAEEVDYVKHTVKSRVEQEMVRFNQSKRDYLMLLREFRGLKLQRDFLRRNPPEAGGKVMISYLGELRAVKFQMRQNQRMRERMDLRFWVWDDEYWGLPF